MTCGIVPSFEELEAVSENVFQEADSIRDGKITFLEFNRWVHDNQPVKSLLNCFSGSSKSSVDHLNAPKHSHKNSERSSIKAQNKKNSQEKASNRSQMGDQDAAIKIQRSFRKHKGAHTRTEKRAENHRAHKKEVSRPQRSSRKSISDHNRSKYSRRDVLMLKEVSLLYPN